jgi:aldehyde:ferredoxin oxidoreductase
MAKMLPEYYEIRDWDKTSGKPSKARMETLGMGELAGSFGIK